MGKKGIVLGSDKDWDYFYSGEPGVNITGLGWIKSYMYEYSGISIYYELDSDAPLVRCGIVRWLRAGWSKINLIKNSHIYKGLGRFAGTFKKIMEYPNLPEAETIARTSQWIKGLSEVALREKTKLYWKILEKRYGKDYQYPKKWYLKIFKNGNHWETMSKEAMESILMVEYMKHLLGKTEKDEIGALFNPSVKKISSNKK